MSTLLLAFLLAAPTPAIFAGDIAHSTLHYTVTHKLHEVEGTSKEVEAKAVIGADGTLRFMARAAVSSFRSGDGSRDEHMQETVEASRYPYVVFKAKTHLDLPGHYPARMKLEVHGQVQFHGQKRDVVAPLHLDFSSARQVRVTGRLTLQLESYGIERPSLLFIPIENACPVDIDLVLQRQGA